MEETLRDILSGEPSYRFSQAKKAVFVDLAEHWEEVSALPKSLREKLETFCPLFIDAEVSVSGGEDAEKALLSMKDGKKIETVLMRHEDGRNTVCVSSMAGCPMKCSFCATGELGLERKLTADEIVSQVLFFARSLKKEGCRVGSVVFMGMGEPFLNYEHVMKAVKILNDKDGLNIGARHISISTCGILDGIRAFADEPLQLNLAISLHAPNDEIRKKLMPVANGYPVKELISAVEEYIRKTHRRVMFEYVMIAGENDSDECAAELAALLKGVLCMVNLIQYNDTGRYKASSFERMKTFKAVLEKRGISSTVRYKFGRDIAGACGQLARRQLTTDDMKR